MIKLIDLNRQDEKRSCEMDEPYKETYHRAKLSEKRHLVIYSDLENYDLSKKQQKLNFEKDFSNTFTPSKHNKNYFDQRSRK